MYRTCECVLTIAGWEIPLFASAVSFWDSFRLHCVQFTSGVTRAGGCPGQNFSCWWWLWWLRRAKTQDRPDGKKTLPMPLSSVWRILESIVLRAYSCILCAPDVRMYALCFIVTYSWIHFVSLWHINEFIVLHWDIFTNSFPFLWSVNSLSFTVQCFYPLCITKTY